MTAQITAVRPQSAQTTGIDGKGDAVMCHRLPFLQRSHGQRAGEGHGLASRRDHPNDIFLNGQARVDIPDGEDRAIGIPRVAEIRVPTQGQIFSQHRGFGIGRFPGAPGAGDNSGLVQLDPGLRQGASQRLTCKGVKDRSGRQVIHDLVRPAEQSGGSQDRPFDTGR